MSELVQVPFHGDLVEAVQNERGVLVSIRRVSESLGVDTAGQLAKLKGKVWACVEMISTHDLDGRKQDMAMISLDSLPMWLANIETSRVAEHVRPKLEKYQKECARVLRDHFFGPATPFPSDPILASIEQTSRALVAIGECRRRQLALEAAQAETRRLVERAQQTAAAAVCRERGLTIGSISDGRFGTVQTYPDEVLREYFDDGDPLVVG